MRIPTTLIMLPCLAAFVLCMLRFFQAGNRPVTDIRFVSGAAAIVLAFVFLIANVFTDHGDGLSQAFFAVALALLVWAIVLFRRPLPKPAR